MSKQDEKDRKQRGGLEKQLEKDIGRVLRNPDGLRRLRNLSDEEWQAAIEKDKAE